MQHLNRLSSLADLDDNKANFQMLLRKGAVITLCVTTVLLISALACTVVKPTPTTISTYNNNYSLAKIGSLFLICKDNIPDENERYISFLRIIQLRMEVDVFIRMAILLSLSGVVFGAHCRGSRFLLRNSPCGLFSKILANIGPTAMALHILSLNIIFMRNILIDKYGNVHTINLIFAYLSIFNMTIYTSLDVCEESAEMIRSRRFKIRLLCIIVNLSLYTTVFRNFIPYTKNVLCHPFVPSSSAFIEYVYICTHLIFYSTMLFDYDDIEIIIFTDVDLEVAEKFMSKYRPFMPTVQNANTDSRCKSLFPA